MKQEQLWPVIQNRICRKCVDGDGLGNCRLPSGVECPLKHFLPEIIQTVTAVDSPDLSAYVALLRVHVCGQCNDQSQDGLCSRRKNLECALDRYFPLVLEVFDMVKDNGRKIAI